ncbi:hypothetical protein [Microbacterium paraoxydans]|uniref:hypothetical protein n=1 Tax=Microbacterium paraoxydans TaxID=199592 RepID=UPI003D73FD3B
MQAVRATVASLETGGNEIGGAFSMQWGWNPDSVAAMTTVLAAAAAVVAGLYAWRAYRLERAREDRASVAMKRQQAEMVSAWTVIQQGENGENYVELRVQNLGSAPVYEVTLGIQLGSVCSYAAKTRVVPPSGRNPMEVRLTERGLERWLTWAKGPARKLAPYVELTFCDSAGAWWFRDTRGALVEIDSERRYLYDESKTRVLSA